MAEQLTLKSTDLTVTISALGAEIQSITGKNGTEFLWHGDNAVWSGRAPILFPICGGLKEDKYIYDGKEYTLEKHGFGRLLTYDIEEKSDTKAVFLLKANEYTKKCYPFDFELRAIFELTDNLLKVTYNVKNIGQSDMYYSIGAHEGYNCPEGIDEYDIVFDKPETLESYVLYGNFIGNDKVTVMHNDTVFPLKREYFAVDALVFKNINSDAVTLIHRNSTKRVKVCFPDHPYFLLWTKPTGEYLCIEPWCGMADILGSGYDIRNKEGIIKLAANSEMNKIHTMEFSE